MTTNTNFTTIVANVTGNVTGDITGDVTGNVTGDVTGNVTGNVTGDITGDVTGAVQYTVEAAADSGAITVASKTVYITKATAAALTLVAPTATTEDGIRIVFVATTAAAHTVTATTIGFNAGDTASDVATFGGAIGDGLTIEAYQGEWYILNSINIILA